MGSIKKLIAILAILTVIAAACGDDAEVTEEEADAALDQIEGSADPDPDPEPDPEVDPDPDPEVDAPEPEPEPEPDPNPVPTDSCVIFRHYQATGLFEEPYYTTVAVEIELSEDDTVEANMPDGTEFDLQSWLPDGEFAGEININFPVSGPGDDVVMPEILVNGEPIHDQLQADFWDNENSFIAEGSDIRDEEKFPKAGCTMGYMVQVEPPSVAFG